MPDRSKAPIVRPFGRLTLPDEEVTALSNGLTLHTLIGGDQDVARMTLIAEGGPSDAANPCIATFAAELLREGSASFSGERIADLMDFNGAWLNCNSSGHYTSLQVASLTSRLPIVLPAALDCMSHPTFPEIAFETILRKAAAKQRLNLSRVSFLANVDNKRLICGSRHPESRLTTAEEIEAIGRDEIESFHNNIFDARLIHAYLSGRMDRQTVDTVVKMLEDIPDRRKGSPITIIPYTAENPVISTVDSPGSLQSAVVMSLPAIARSHPDYNDLRMTVTALGGYFGSRLMLNIREDKGYTYGISASLLGSREGSYITIGAQCDNRHAMDLIEEVKAETARMADHPLDDDELSRLKFNLSSDLASTLDSPFTVMDYYESHRLVGTPDGYFESQFNSLSRLDAERICEIARRYLDATAFRISVAGDLSKTAGL